MPAHDVDPDRVLAPSLAYLRDVVARLPVESDTAFVVMPFTAPYAGYYASFYRPALEHCGYRAFRAWDGLRVRTTPISSSPSSTRPAWSGPTSPSWIPPPPIRSAPRRRSASWA